MNGIDTDTWNPATDDFLPPSERFQADTVAVGKAAAKATLQRALGLQLRPDVPLIVFIGRWVSERNLMRCGFRM